MTITKSQIERRNQYIGASEIAAILGLDRYRSAWDVWAAKTGRTEQIDAGQAADAGRRFESAILEWAEEQIGKLDRRGTERRIKGTPILVHCDALTAAKREPVEAKTSGLFGQLDPEWGEPGTDQIPLRHLVQVQIQLAATGADICYVPAFLGGRGYCLYRVAADKAVQERLIAKAVEFWEKHVLMNEPPDATPSLETLKSLRRTPGKTLDLPSHLAPIIEQYEKIRESRLNLEREEEDLKRQIISAFGDAEYIRLPDGRILAYLEQKTNDIDRKRLAIEYPQIFALCSVERKYRVLRFKKGE